MSQIRLCQAFPFFPGYRLVLLFAVLSPLHGCSRVPACPRIKRGIPFILMLGQPVPVSHSMYEMPGVLITRKGCLTQLKPV